MTTSIHEIEEAQHNYESEENMAVQEASMFFNEESADISRGINQALAAGKFVVVERHNRFCRCTDAFVGSYPAHFESFATREEAEVRQQALYAEGDDETDISILPEKLVPAPVVSDDEDDLPF